MANLKEVAVTQAITLIQTLADDVMWESVFREYFESPELFHSMDVRLEPGTATITLHLHDSENLERVYTQVVEIKETGVVVTAEDAGDLVRAAIQSCRLPR